MKRTLLATLCKSNEKFSPDYRNAKHDSKGILPAESLLGRYITRQLDLLKPPNIIKKVLRDKNRWFKNHGYFSPHRIHERGGILERRSQIGKKLLSKKYCQEIIFKPTGA